MPWVQASVSLFFFTLSLCVLIHLQADESHIYKSSLDLSLKIPTLKSGCPFKPSAWMSNRHLKSHMSNNTSQTEFLIFVSRTCPPAPTVFPTSVHSHSILLVNVGTLEPSLILLFLSHQMPKPSGNRVSSTSHF